MSSRVLVLGAGVMGSALAVPIADNGHGVTLVGTHLDDAIIAALQADRGGHPGLGATLPEGVDPVAFSDLGQGHFDEADQVILGVSSPGIGWAVDVLARLLPSHTPLALVTKGLMAKDQGPCETYVDALPVQLAARGVSTVPIVGIGGPAIARELALRQPTIAVYASHDAAQGEALARLVRTPYYRPVPSNDPIGVEACAALKNLYAIGVSAMMSRYIDPDPNKPHFRNPTAACFNQAVREIASLVAWMGGERDTVFDRAGIGDLHVTVGGGRNSRLGLELGKGETLASVLNGTLKGETVEGVDTGRVLQPALDRAFQSGHLSAGDFPLALAVLDAISTETPFTFDFERL